MHSINVGVLGGLLKTRAEVGDRLKAKTSSGSSQIVPKNRHGFKVGPVQSFSHNYDIVPAVDNPAHLLDRASAPWMWPIGELESKTVVTKASQGKVGEFVMLGSGFLVSPCYILTAAHTVYGEELSPDPGKDYSMWFRAGSSVKGAFFCWQDNCYASGLRRS